MFAGTVLSRLIVSRGVVVLGNSRRKSGPPSGLDKAKGPAGAADPSLFHVHRAPSISPGEAEFYALTNTITQTEIGQVGGENRRWRWESAVRVHH